MTEQEIQTVEAQNEYRATGEPMLWVRARRQIIVMGWVRFMGETFQLPERFALGLVGQGEVEQVINFVAPLNWIQQAPGPLEPYQMRGDFATQGSREGGNVQRGGQPGDLQLRQQAAAKVATELQPQVERGTPLPPARPPQMDPGQFKGGHPPQRHPSPMRAPSRASMRSPSRHQ